MIFFTCRNDLFCKLPESVYLYTNVCTLQGTVRTIFLYKETFYQNEWNSVLTFLTVRAGFNSITFLSRNDLPSLFFQDWQQKWSPLKKWLEYVKSLFRSPMHPWGIWKCHRHFKGSKLSTAVCWVCQQHHGKEILSFLMIL